MKKILIIDDDRELTVEIEEIFKDQGYETEIANSGLDGTLKIIEGKYDVIILDYKMPGLNGIELLKSLKESLHDTKVYLISGSLYIDNLIDENGLRPLVRQTLAKPFNIDLLIRNIADDGQR